MQRHCPAPEPTAASRRQGCRLGDAGQPEKPRIEGLRFLFPPCGHGQLYVLESDDLEAHGCLLTGGPTWQSTPETASLPHDMGSLIKKRRKRMRKKKHKKMLKATRWQRRAGK